MNILEKDIEDLVYHALNTDASLLYDRGLELRTLTNYGKPVILRQYQLGGYGIMDLLVVSYDSLDKCFDIDIIELKKDAVDYKTLDQAIRYHKGIAHYIELHFPRTKYKIKISLIGRSVDLSATSSLCYLPDLWRTVDIYTYALDFINGLTFTSIEGYHLAKPQFAEPQPDFIKELKRTVRASLKGQVLEMWDQKEAINELTDEQEIL